MKTIFLFLIFAYSFSINAHILQEVNITQNGQNLHFEITSSDPYDLIDLGFTVNRVGNTIEIQLCQHITDAAHPSTITKNIDVPVSDGVNYTITIELYNSDNGQNCDNQVLSDSITINISTPLSDSITLGINTNEKLRNSVLLYPNPISKYLYVDINEPSVKINKFKITDMSGQTIQVTNSAKVIDLRYLKKGQYVVIIYTNFGVLVRKIIKL